MTVQGILDNDFYIGTLRQGKYTRKKINGKDIRRDELKATKRQRIRDIMKHPEQEETLEETYDELESDLLRRMEGLQNQIAMTVDKRNTIIQVNRASKTAMEVFDDILNKPKLDRNDLQLIIRKIKVYEDHIEIQLKPDIDSILSSGTLP